jgi:cytochrome c551/c552
LAAVIWNMSISGPADPSRTGLSENQAADVFAYFAAQRYFEPLGDAGRGKRVFAEKHCNACHGFSDRGSSEAKPPTEWSSLRDPVAFAQELWNRHPAMVSAFARQGLHDPRFTSRELNDLLLYLENLPVIRERESRLLLASSDTGRMLFQSKGCADCHRAKRALANRPWRSMAEICAAMWNHPFANGENHPYLTYSDMSGLVSYLWSLQDRGDNRRGGRIFARKGCVSCHENRGKGGDGVSISLFSGHEAIPVMMVMALGNHGPHRAIG